MGKIKRRDFGLLEETLPIWASILLVAQVRRLYLLGVESVDAYLRILGNWCGKQAIITTLNIISYSNVYPTPLHQTNDTCFLLVSGSVSSLK